MFSNPLFILHALIITSNIKTIIYRKILKQFQENTLKNSANFIEPHGQKEPFPLKCICWKIKTKPIGNVNLQLAQVLTKKMKQLHQSI